MIVFPQIAMTDAILTSSNVPETDHAEWSNLTDYTAGDYVISVDTHTVYRCLVTHTVGVEGAQDPDAEQVALADPLIADPSPIYWQVISATNRWKAFDGKPSVLTTQADSVEYVFTPGETVTGIGFFRVSAEDVRIVVTDPTDGVVFDETFDLIDNTAVIDWFTYFFEPFTLLSQFVTTGLPPYPNATIQVILSAPGGTVQVGQIAFGRARNLGFMRIGPSQINGLDFSFVQNDEFGNLTTVQREATRITTFSAVVDTTRLLGVAQLLQNFNAGTKAVWVGDDDARKAAAAYGFYRDYRAVWQVGDHTLLDIEVQGLV